ncbi:hydroxyphenylacetyl-CoA thioesterase PaaI [Azoarcus indigens]|uniref:Acyl-CoA thioesterase n=1 Tax=Azoarcus indigens TaxID=29545 RepID=A0A4R6DQ96_9RHOO|nr:hydroxyphenylacetyl-CoA thioesterase PaaI [Azoarcus indigens]NMG67529.1 hydroxyphenylacetyl-CoA thioesterase PaaI [Azoarcus indigens]TDN47127.1 acyl-CoA thioesterase [Azoarcus indigens]
MSEAQYRDIAGGLDPQALAERVRDGMYERDQAARSLEMGFTEVGPGRATMTMRVREDMLNGFRICHGGFITTLADTAFAYACNSGNEQTVASGISVDFMAPGRPGDLLTAAAQRVSESGRTGVYDITVTNQSGELIAVMRGKSYRIKGRPVVEL